LLLCLAAGIVEERAEKRLRRLCREGKLPKPWEYYVNERRSGNKTWTAIEREVRQELESQPRNIISVTVTRGSTAANGIAPDRSAASQQDTKETSRSAVKKEPIEIDPEELGIWKDILSEEEMRFILAGWTEGDMYGIVTWASPLEEDLTFQRKLARWFNMRTSYGRNSHLDSW